jgi:hypothetical protein
LRGRLEIESGELHQQISALEKLSQKALHQACDQLVKQKTVDDLPQLLKMLF